MESADKAAEVYQLRVWIRKISPQIWRRLLVQSDSTIAQLHETLQIAFGWTDEHLHRNHFRTRANRMHDEYPIYGLRWVKQARNRLETF